MTEGRDDRPSRDSKLKMNYIDHWESCMKNHNQKEVNSMTKLRIHSQTNLKEHTQEMINDERTRMRKFQAIPTRTNLEK